MEGGGTVQYLPHIQKTLITTLQKTTVNCFMPGKHWLALSTSITNDQMEVANSKQ
jgi:hypothetical protein